MFDRCMEYDADKNLYVVAAEKYAAIKIGVTTCRPESRIVALQCGCPEELILVGSFFPVKNCHEKRLHRRFKEHHLRGEWFRLNEATMSVLAKILEFTPAGERILLETCGVQV